MFINLTAVEKKIILFSLAYKHHQIRNRMRVENRTVRIL